MQEVKLRLTADIDQATKEVAGFSKEYAALVNQVQKPLRQVNAYRDLEQSLEQTSKQVATTKTKLGELQAALINTEHPSERLKQEFKSVGKELQVLQRLEATQANQLARMRGELKSAGVDTTRLTQEQRRLNAELTAGLNAGRNEAAVRGIRQRNAELKQLAISQRQANLEQARTDLGVNRYRAAQAEIQRLRGQYDLLRRSGNVTAKELSVAQQQLTQKIRESKQAMSELASGSGSGSGGVVAGLAARLGIGGGLGAAGGLAGGAALAGAYASAVDPIKKMEAQLKLATDGQAEFNEAQAETFRIAQENQAPLEDVVTLYSRLSPALSDVGRGQGDALKIIEAVTKSLRISGATAQETAATIQQFSQALGSGVLRGEEFNTLAESSPRLLRALADGLKVNVGALREMAAEGQLTSDVIADALIGQLPRLTAEASQLPDTFAGAMTKLTNELQVALGQFDKFSGLSDEIIGRLNLMAKAINSATSAGSTESASNLAAIGLELARLNPAMDLFFRLAGGKKLTEQLAKSTAEEKQAFEYRAGLFAMHAAEMKALRLRSVQDTTELLDQQVETTKEKLQEQVAAERKAATDLEQAKQAQIETHQRYQDALVKLQGGAKSEPSFMGAVDLKVGARNALQSGDVEEAKRQAQAALEILMQLAEAGENTYGFAGFIKELQAIETSADQKGIDEAQKKLEKAKDTVAITEQALKGLKDMEVTAAMTPDAQQKLLDQMAELAKKAGLIMTIPVTVAAQDYTQPYTLQDPGPVPGYAAGGILRGPGTGTSDSILMYGSNGEGVLTARAVRHYGPELVHRLNRLRVPKFAEGGVVGARMMPSIPPISPSLLMSSSSNAESFGTVNLNLDGHSYQMQANEQNFAELVKRQKWKRGSTRT